jgi:hypothetical protein
MAARDITLNTLQTSQTDIGLYPLPADPARPAKTFNVFLRSMGFRPVGQAPSVHGLSLNTLETSPSDVRVYAVPSTVQAPATQNVVITLYPSTALDAFVVGPAAFTITGESVNLLAGRRLYVSPAGFLVTGEEIKFGVKRVDATRGTGLGIDTKAYDERRRQLDDDEDLLALVRAFVEVM